MRECYSCGSGATYVGKTRIGTYCEYWFLNGIENQYLCSRCYAKYIHNPNPKNKERRHKWLRERNCRRIVYHGKPILLDKVPRTGFCTICTRNTHDKSCKTTQMFHFGKYEYNNPLENCLELCYRCKMELYWSIKHELQTIEPSCH
jgi:hypothetical protein